jgi:hypothetical protein
MYSTQISYFFFRLKIASNPVNTLITVSCLLTILLLCTRRVRQLPECRVAG